MPPPSNAALDSLWTPQALIATVLVGEAVAIVVALVSTPVDRWVLFGLASLVAQWISLTGLGAIYLFRRRLARLPAISLAWACLFLLMMSAYVISVLAQASWWRPAGDPIDASFTPRLLGTTLVVGMLGVVAFQNYYTSRRLALRAKQAELEALQARVHPHFLFNTLNSAAALVHARPDDAERVLLDLSDLFRAALSEPGWVPLQHELDLCRRYLAIEQLRFGDRLKVEWHMGEDLGALHVPLLAVQPLVENAVAHGLDDTDHGRRVRIDVMQAGGALHVSVANAIAKTPHPRAGGHGIGLAAVRARIEAVTQGRGRLEAGEKGGDFVARLLIPRDPMPGSGQATIS
jgi:two-component system sensor histidine kinase AlgZ